MLYYAYQLPWIVKTDDDTVNNVWTLNEVINNMEDKNETQVILILACLTQTFQGCDSMSS